ncbi:hypothetical protein VPH35_022108 [Triticum aestivum]
MFYPNPTIWNMYMKEYISHNVMLASIRISERDLEDLEPEFSGLDQFVAGKGGQRLLHYEYAIGDVLLRHLVGVAGDHLRAGLGFVREEDVDLEGHCQRRQSADALASTEIVGEVGTHLVVGVVLLGAVDDEVIAAHGVAPPDTPIPDLPWVMLDRIAHCTLPGDDTDADGTTPEVSETCTGRPIAVSLRVAPPPAVSRLYLHFPDGLRPEMKLLEPPSVLAAHGRSILFQTYVPHIDQCRPNYYPMDYFVYTAPGRPGKRPFLRRLPPCFKGGQVNPEVDKLFLPYRYQQQRTMNSDNIGLLCYGEEEFTVAELYSWGELCLLHHAPGKAMEWEFRTLQMPYGKGVPDFLYGSWNTDSVIPFGGSLCWVDCYLGLLFVTVHGDLTRPPRYVSMPADLDTRRLYIDPGVPDPARRVCVTDSGMVKLICISDAAGRSVHIHSSDFKIRTWNLSNGIWKKDATMEARELENVLSSDKRQPLLLPKFPIMNLVDHDVVCFVLNNRDRNFWLVEVNLRKKALGAVTLYTNEEKENQAAAEEHLTWDDIVRNTFFTTVSVNSISFIPSQFTMYLDKHAIKRYLSLMLCDYPCHSC